MDYTKGVLDKDATTEEVAQDIASRFDEGTEANQTALDEIENIRKHLKGVAPDRKAWQHPDSPNYTVPYMETLVDTIIAKFFLAVLAHNPVIRFMQESKSSIYAARLMERVVHYMINKRIPNAFTHLYLWLHEAVSVGLGLLYVYYDKVERKFTQMTTVMGPDGSPYMDDNGKPVRVPELVTQVDYEGFKFDVLDLEDVAGDWENVDNENYIIREYIEPETYLHRTKTLGYKEMDMEVLNKLTCANTAKRNYLSTVDDAVDDKFRRKLEILHYYGLGYIENGDELENIKITIFKKKDENGSNIEIARASSAMCPIIPMRFKPTLKRFQGRGVGQQTRHLNDELNISYNARLLNISHALHTGWIVGDDAGVNEEELSSRPGMVVHCANPADLVQIKGTPLPPDTFNTAEETKGMMRDVTAAQEIVQGKAQRQELATTASILDSNAKQRLEVHTFRMAKEGWGKLGDILKIGITEMFDPDNPMLVILGKDEIDQFSGQLPDGMVDENGMIEIGPELLRGAMYATTEVSALAGDSRAQRQELLQLIQMVMQMNGGQGWMTDKVDPKTGAPIMEQLNIGHAIKELYRLWGRHDMSVMLREYPMPQQPQEGQQQEQRGPGSEPPGYSAAPNQAEMEARLTAAMDQAVTGG